MLLVGPDRVPPAAIYRDLTHLLQGVRLPGVVSSF